MKILVADDDATSLNILQAVLSKWGYDMEAVHDGEEAWEALSQPQAPRLSILDWMMPKINGVEVTKKLKSHDPSAYTILLTSKDSPDAISTALLAGADDFVAKPFNQHELHARLEVGKRMITLYDQLSEANVKLKRYASEMEVLVEEKAKQLVHSDRLSSLGMLTAGVAHEINNPTTFISGNVQTLQKFWPVQEKFIKTSKKDYSDYDKLMFICEEMPEVIEGIRNGALRISQIVSGLKTFARQDTQKNIDYDIHQAIDDALLLCHNLLKYNVTTKKLYCSNLPDLNGDRQKIEQVFVNLFSNAADAMTGLEEGILTIETSVAEGNVIIKVSDNGKGLTDEALKKMWDPFFTTKPVGEGTGLGMSISHGIIADHGGTISAANRPEGGAEFLIKLPIKDKKDNS
jgi:C4-dicarboxylate-specific signal transduction histidine kinase